MKLYRVIFGWAFLLSLPVWERGLKLGYAWVAELQKRSLPVWERGLKLRFLSNPDPGEKVAPRVGAWIETSAYKIAYTSARSLPVWERGLKLD